MKRRHVSIPLVCIPAIVVLLCAPATSFATDGQPAAIDLREVDRAFDALGRGQVRTALLRLPSPSGAFVEFHIRESETMVPALRTKFPQLRSYVGVAADASTRRLRMERSPRGLNVRIYGDDPYEIVPRADGSHRFRDPFEEPSTRAGCEVDETHSGQGLASAGPGESLRGVDATRRTYRLAMSATQPFLLNTGSVPDVMASFMTIVNRLNEILERDANVTLNLIAGTDLLISSDPADFTSGDLSTLIAENQLWTDSIVGSGAYDVGHLLDSGFGGGLSYVGTPCNASLKAQSSSIVSLPLSESFIINVVGHQLTHLLGARHTFNGLISQCVGQWSSASPYEPGSGSTIQSYAGLCGSDNLQSSRDDYLHFATVEQIQSRLDGCAASAATGNSAPTASAPTSSHVIPRGTPFRICGAGSDPDGDPLTYRWEQSDAGLQSSLAQGDTGSGPLFRSFAGSSDPCRNFPKEAFTGQTSPGETLPETDRSLSFRLTVQDAQGGVDVSDPFTIDVFSGAGAFQLSQPASGELWFAGETRTVVWDVAATLLPPVSCSTVSIRLSDDGGVSYDVELLAGAPNDGDADVVVPEIDVWQPQARVGLFCEGNLFFNVTDAFDVAGSECVDEDGDGFRTGPPTDCPDTLTLDCDDGAAAVFPSAAELCDGVRNDCSAPGWPSVAGTLEGDDDGDGFSECANDCDDANPDRYPGAPEINDGADQQCPGDPAFGLVDELSQRIVFSSNTRIDWPDQPGTSLYQLARATSFDFQSDCSAVEVVLSEHDEHDEPAPDDAFAYLVRARAPFAGSWDVETASAARVVSCEAESICDDGIDNDNDGATDCDDPDCPQSACSSSLEFVDTFGDDLAPTAVIDFLAPLAVDPDDWILIEVTAPEGPYSLCLHNAAFYRDNYLSFAATGASIPSGNWEKYFRSPSAGGTWIGPVTSGFVNFYGGACWGPYSWCPERVLNPATRPTLRPFESNACEAFNTGTTGCGDGTWSLTLRVGETRSATCGF